MTGIGWNNVPGMGGGGVRSLETSGQGRSVEDD